MGWLAFFEGCIAIEWAGVQEVHYLWLGRRNTGKRWATSLVVKLWEVAWDMWDHRIQIKVHTETAQDQARHQFVLVAVLSEYAFGRAGLPRRDWPMFACPLSSLLARSLHYLDAWLLRVRTARHRQTRRAASGATLTNLAEDDLPTLNRPRRIFQQFLNPVSPSVVSLTPLSLLFSLLSCHIFSGNVFTPHIVRHSPFFGPSKGDTKPPRHIV
jgi:hypothetical protein